MLEQCPKCGSKEILSDYYEDCWYWWCGFCGKDLTMLYESIYKEDEALTE